MKHCSRVSNSFKTLLKCCGRVVRAYLTTEFDQAILQLLLVQLHVFQFLDAACKLSFQFLSLCLIRVQAKGVLHTSSCYSNIAVPCPACMKVCSATQSLPSGVHEISADARDSCVSCGGTRELCQDLVLAVVSLAATLTVSTSDCRADAVGLLREPSRRACWGLFCAATAAAGLASSLALAYRTASLCHAQASDQLERTQLQ